MNYKIMKIALIVCLCVSNIFISTYAEDFDEEIVEIAPEMDEIIEEDYNELIDEMCDELALVSVEYDNALFGVPNDIEYRSQHTPVQAQATSSRCMLYASVAAIECNMIKNGISIDNQVATADNFKLSEKYAWKTYDKETGFKSYGDGVNEAYLWPILMNWKGLVTTDSYSDTLEFNMVRINDIYSIPASEIKQAVMEKGAVVMGYTCNGINSLLSENPKIFAYNSTSHEEKVGHAVAIIGWDDNFPKENFNESVRPSADGAWLCKNSQGILEGCYSWISYETTDIVQCYVYETGQIDKYIHNYSTDDLPIFTQTAPNVQTLDGVTALFRTRGMHTISVYDDILDEQDPLSGKKIYSQEVNIEYDGHHTIELSQPVILNPGERFSVLIDDAPYWSNGGRVHALCNDVEGTGSEGTLSIAETSYTIGASDSGAQIHATAGEGVAITYTSNDTNVCTVDSNGYITPVTGGSTTVIISTATSSKTRRVKVYRDLSIAQITVDKAVYTGNELKPSYSVKMNGKDIPITEFDTVYDKNILAGSSATLTITPAKSNPSSYYSGSKTTSFSISKAKLTDFEGLSEVTYNPSRIYTKADAGNEYLVAVPSQDGKYLSDGTYSNGKMTVSISGSPNILNGSITYPVTLKPLKINSADIMVSLASDKSVYTQLYKTGTYPIFYYNGKQVKPKANVRVNVGGNTYDVMDGVSVTYSNNTAVTPSNITQSNAAKAMVKLSGLYTGETTAYYQITSMVAPMLDLSKATVEPLSFSFMTTDANQIDTINNEISVTLDGMSLNKEKDYVLNCSSVNFGVANADGYTAYVRPAGGSIYLGESSFKIFVNSPVADCTHARTYRKTIIVKYASCTEDGEKYVMCTKCNSELSREIMPAKGHDYGAYTSDENATCTKDGTKSAVCSICGNVDTVLDEGSRLPHTWDRGVVTKEPTATEKGERTYTCAVCHVIKTEDIPVKSEEPGNPTNPVNPPSDEKDDTEEKTENDNIVSETVTLSNGKKGDVSATITINSYDATGNKLPMVDLKDSFTSNGKKITFKKAKYMQLPGYTFKGWYLNGKKITSITAAKLATLGNPTVTATFTENTYSVVYKFTKPEKKAKIIGKVATQKKIKYTSEVTLNDGSVVTAQAKIKLPDKTYEYHNYKLVGWTTTKGSDRVDYKLGETTSKLVLKKNGKITLYGVWELVENN